MGLLFGDQFIDIARLGRVSLGRKQAKRAAYLLIVRGIHENSIVFDAISSAPEATLSSI